MIRKVNDGQLQAAMNGSAVLMYFTAQWCGPCKVMKPQFERAVSSLGGKVDAVLADIDECPKAVRAFGLSKVPTIILAKSGVEVARRSGMASTSDVLAMVQSHLTR